MKKMEKEMETATGTATEKETSTATENTKKNTRRSKLKNLTIQIDPKTSMVIKTYLAMKNMTVKEYLLGLIKADMEKAGISL